VNTPDQIANCANCATAKHGNRHFLSSAKLFTHYKSSTVPEGGWNFENFRSPAGVQLVRDQINVQRMAKLKGARLLTKPLTLLMRAQVLSVITIFGKRYAAATGLGLTPGQRGTDFYGKQVTRVLTVNQHSGLWAQAIEEAFAKEGASVTATVRPAMQSVADDVLDKTTTLLTGQKASDVSKHVIRTQVNEIATKVTRINNTTRSNLSKLIGKAIDDGTPPFAVMELVRDKIPGIATNRVPTIVRTEMGLAADRASIRAMKDSAVVTHVSVTGCEAIEKGIPTWNGIPTCNIRNVPIEYSGELQFHPNHTGAIIASVFRKRDGGVQATPTQQGAGGIGTWEDRGRPVPALVADSPAKPPSAPPPPASPAAPATPKPPKPPKPLAPKPLAPKPASPIPNIVNPKPIALPVTDPVAAATPPFPTPKPPSVAADITEALGPMARREVGHLRNGWTVPEKLEDILQIDKDLKATGSSLSNWDGVNLADLANDSPDRAAKLLKDFDSIFGMSPVELEKHVLAGIDKAAYNSTRIRISIDTDTQATIAGTIRSESGGLTTFTRRFDTVSSRGNKVSHVFFEVDKDFQGKDVGKALSKQFLSLYDHMGVGMIDIHANINVGGYAWARYGFIPEDYSWPELVLDSIRQWKTVRNVGRLGFGPATDMLTANQIAELDDFFAVLADSKNPLDVREIASLKYDIYKDEPNPSGTGSVKKTTTIGKQILLNADWYGKIPLVNPDDYSVYRKYIE
jgi:hypothetical protein